MACAAVEDLADGTDAEKRSRRSAYSAEWKRVQECVSRTATAWLPNRVPGLDEEETYPTIIDLNEQDPSFNPEFGRLFECVCAFFLLVILTFVSSVFRRCLRQ